MLQSSQQVVFPLPFTLKKYLKAKEELWKNSNISLCKNIIVKKIVLKEPKFFEIS
jgi:hypothetical protein